MSYESTTQGGIDDQGTGTNSSSSFIFATHEFKLYEQTVKHHVI